MFLGFLKSQRKMLLATIVVTKDFHIYVFRTETAGVIAATLLMLQ